MNEDTIFSADDYLDTGISFTHFPDNQVYEILFSHLVRNLGCEDCDLNPTMLFKEDLEPMGVDSLTFYEAMTALEAVFDVQIDKKDFVYLKRVDHVLAFFLYGIILKRENVARRRRKGLQRKFIKSYIKIPNPVGLYGAGKEKMHFIKIVATHFC